MFDKNVILAGGKARPLHPPLSYQGLQSIWETRNGQVYLRSKLDLDTDGVTPPGVVMDASHQDDTNVHNPNGSPLDSFHVPYIVDPIGFFPWLSTQGIDIALGAIALVQYQGHCVPCLVGDLGPRDKFGEGSAYLREQFGFHVVVNGRVLDAGIDAGVEYVLFPGSGNGHGRTLEEINAVAAQLSQHL